MKNLFSRDENGKVIVLPQAWLLEPFRAIQDKYKEQDIADVEMGLVWFCADYRSDFLEGEMAARAVKVKKAIYGNRNVKIDSVTYAAIKFYEDNQDTPKIKLLKALNVAIEKATATISAASLSNLDDIKVFSDIVTKLPGMIESLDRIEVNVKKESKSDSNVVGSAEKGVYEDG